jgi:uncharacterized protein YecE (DUF72 family)
MQERQLDLGFGADMTRRDGARSAPEGSPAPSAPGTVRFGTSSFAWADWVGPFYPAGTRPADYLRAYAMHFDAVEVDATYYAIPAPRTVDGWAAKTPPGFRLAAKFPRSITHAGDGPRPDPGRVLAPAATYAERDLFLGVMQRLSGRLGPLVLQFPFFSRAAFPSPGPFLERLDRFLGDLPLSHAYAVEIRNPTWLGEPLATVCRRHRAALVLVDQEWMPHGDRVARRLDPVTGDFAYVRLLGDRARIEAITTTWEREVIDRQASLDRWAGLLVDLALRGIATYVFVNNHYAGHAPATVRRLRELFEQRLAGGAGTAPPETDSPPPGR